MVLRLAAAVFLLVAVVVMLRKTLLQETAKLVSLLEAVRQQQEPACLAR